MSEEGTQPHRPVDCDLSHDVEQEEFEGSILTLGRTSSVDVIIMTPLPTKVVSSRRAGRAIQSKSIY